MTDRTVKVALVAEVSNYIAGMKQAAAYTSYVGTEAQKLAMKKESIQKVGSSLLAIGAVAAAGVALAVKSFADFDAKMSQVKTLSHATASQMDQLGAAALTMGQKIGFSATEAADAEIELVKAGISVSDMMGGALKGSLDLAAAGQIDVGKATEIATIAMTQFGLKGKDVPHVADLLAAGADKALGGVSDLGEALKSGGLVASQFGLTLDDTVGTLSAFANAGLIGETAGTDLRQMLLKLGNPSKEAADSMKQLGIHLYDASGKFVGITDLSGQLADKMHKLTPEARNSALAVIFGSRAIAGANVLYKEGADGIGKWIGKVNDAGFAAQQARGKMDNLQGDISKLGAAFQTDLIESGGTVNGVLRGTVQTVTNLTTAFSGLGGPAQGTLMTVGGIVAAIGLLGGGALIVIPKLAAMKMAMEELKVSSKGVALATGAVGLAITALVVVLGMVATAQADAKASADQFSDTLDAQTGAFTKNTRAALVKQLTDKGVYGDAKRAGVGQKELTDAILNGGDALDKVNAKIQGKNNFVDFFNGSGIAAGNAAASIQTISSGLAMSKQGFIDAQKAGDGSVASTDAAAASTETAAGAYQTAADKAKGLADAVANLTDQINKANGVGQDSVSANAAYRKALADADETIAKAQKHVKGYSMGINENTTTGAANAAMLADLAKSNEATAKATLAANGNTDQYQKTLAAGRQAVIDRAKALGATATQAQALADKVAKIPTKKEIQLLVDTAPATLALKQFLDDLNNIPGKRDVVINTVMRTTGAPHGQVGAAYDNSGTASVVDPSKNAAGGAISGPGTGTSDSIPAMLSNGEHVLTASDVVGLGGQAAVYRMRRGIAAGTTPRFAHGGGVDFPSRASAINRYANGGFVQPALYTPAPQYSAHNCGGGGGSARSGAQVQVDVHTSPGMSEETVGRISADQINYELRRNV